MQLQFKSMFFNCNCNWNMCFNCNCNSKTCVCQVVELQLHLKSMFLFNCNCNWNTCFLIAIAIKTRVFCQNMFSNWIELLRFDSIRFNSIHFCQEQGARRGGPIPPFLPGRVPRQGHPCVFQEIWLEKMYTLVGSMTKHPQTV